MSFAQTGTIAHGATALTFNTGALSCGDQGATHDFSATGTDQLFQHFWAICQDADPTACRLNSPTTTQVGVGPCGAETARMSYSSFQSRALDVTWIVTVNEAMPGASGNAVSRVLITNTGASPTNVNLFAYFDVDFCGAGSFADDQASGSMSSVARVHTIRDATCSPAEFLELCAAGADGDAADAFPNLRNAVLQGCPDWTTAPFSAGGSFGPMDYTGTFHWKDRMLGGGQTLEAYVVIGHNLAHSPCSTFATAASYGMPSGANATLSAPIRPVIGSVFELAVTNANPDASAVLFIDIAPISLPIGGLTILTLPLSMLPFTLDPMGNLSYCQRAGTRSAFCGAQVTLQFIYIDPNSTATLPASATNGLTLTFGR